MDKAALEYRDCAFPANSLNILPTQMRCGVFSQKHKQNDLLDVRLPFVIIKASAYTNADEVLVVVPGGPGYGSQTSANTVSYWYQYFSSTSRNFDVLLFEPRGTPNATPSLECQQIQRAGLENFARNLSSSQEYASLFKAVSSCVKDSEGGRPRFGMSSKQQANDVDTLVGLTAYKKVHLLGESWGTRVVLQTKSEKIASRILDSPYPQGKGGITDWVKNVDLRFDIYRNYFSNFDKLWKEAVEALNKKPLTGDYKTGLEEPYAEIKYVLNEQRLAALAFYALYHENMRMPFYNALMYIANSNAEISNNKSANESLGGNSNKDSFVSLIQSYIKGHFDPAFSPLAWYAAECAECAECAEGSQISKGEFALLEKRYAKYNYLLAGMWDYDVCRLPELQSEESGFVNKERNADYPSLPTLILSGQYDPVTPSHWALELAETLGDKAILHIANGAGHGILAADYCRASLLVDFLNKESIKPTNYCD